jgi:hypothetical protein
MGAKRGPLDERFWRFVGPETATGCRLWTGATDTRGYGVINVGNHAIDKAHRVAWRLARGPIPRGLFVCHHCDNRACVTDSHLFLGTNSDNVADMMAKQRNQHGERHHAARLTEETVRAIRSSTETQARLSKRFGVSQSVISEVRTRKAWAHIR